MSKSTCSASFGSSEDKIWSLITGQSDHTWRTDLLRIEEGEKKYSVVEYYKNGDVVTAEVSMSYKRQRLRGKKNLFTYEKKQPDDPFYGRSDLS